MVSLMVDGDSGFAFSLFYHFAYFNNLFGIRKFEVIAALRSIIIFHLKSKFRGELLGR